MQNCRDNTEGDRCERCAPGFYGVVRGFHEDCKPCACPLTNPENKYDLCLLVLLFSKVTCLLIDLLYTYQYVKFLSLISSFSPTCVKEGFDDYRCVACPEGYEGKYCER